jgi:hypothetical protein
MGQWTMQGWPVHGSGSPELGLTAAPGHSGLPQELQQEGRDVARPGDCSPGLGRW